MNHKFSYEEARQIPVNPLRSQINPHGKNQHLQHNKMLKWHVIQDFRRFVPEWKRFGIWRAVQKIAGNISKVYVSAMGLTIVARFLMPVKKSLRSIVCLLDSLIGEFYSFMDEFFMMGEEVLQPVSAGKNISGGVIRGSRFKALQTAMMRFPWWRIYGAHHLFVKCPLQFPFKLPFTTHLLRLRPVPA